MAALLIFLLIAVQGVLVSRPSAPRPLLVLSRIRPDSSLWIRDVDTGRAYRVADSEFGINPAWSPDGRWLAFNELLPAGESNVYAFNMVTGVKQYVGNVPIPFRPLWSPNSRWLIFYSGIVSVSGLSYVEVTPTRTSGQKFLAPGWPDIVWSVNSKWLYYRRPGDEDDLFMLPSECLINATCPDVERIIHLRRRIDGLMGWMPNKRELMFISTPVQSRQPHLYTVDSQTGFVSPLLDENVLNTEPSWSPDGELLAVSLLKPEDYDLLNVTVDIPGLYLIDHDGRQKLIWDGVAGQITWSPVGDYLVFEGVSEDGRDRSIYIYNHTTGLVKNISPKGALETTPAWGIFPGKPLLG